MEYTWKCTLECCILSVNNWNTCFQRKSDDKFPQTQSDINVNLIRSLYWQLLQTCHFYQQQRIWWGHALVYVSKIRNRHQHVKEVKCFHVMYCGSITGMRQIISSTSKTFFRISFRLKNLVSSMKTQQEIRKAYAVNFIFLSRNNY